LLTQNRFATCLTELRCRLSVMCQCIINTATFYWAWWYDRRAAVFWGV